MLRPLFVGLMRSVPSVIGGSRGGRLNLERKMRSSVLSVFSFSLFAVIQSVISARQLSIRGIAVVRSATSSQLKVVYS